MSVVKVYGAPNVCANRTLGDRLSGGSSLARCDLIVWRRYVAGWTSPVQETARRLEARGAADPVAQRALLLLHRLVREQT